MSGNMPGTGKKSLEREGGALAASSPCMGAKQQALKGKSLPGEASVLGEREGCAKPLAFMQRHRHQQAGCGGRPLLQNEGTSGGRPNWRQEKRKKS